MFRHPFSFLLKVLLGYVFFAFLLLILFSFSFEIYLEQKYLSFLQRELPAFFSLFHPQPKKTLRVEGGGRPFLEKLSGLRLVSSEELKRLAGIKEEAFILRKDWQTLEMVRLFKAKKECLSCHGKLKEGDNLGGLVWKVSWREDWEKGGKNFLIILLFMLPFFLLGLFLYERRHSQKILKPFLLLEKELEKVKNFEDLLRLLQAFKKLPSQLEETSKVHKCLAVLSDLLGKLAVSREIFDFELKLMEKFIITSELMKNWDFYILALIEEINEILDVPFLFFLFYSGDEVFACEVFWYKRPSPSLRESIEAQLTSIIQESLSLNSLNFNHHVFLADEDLGLTSIKLVKTKTLILEAPAIGGIVGVGLGSLFLNKAQELALELVLSSILNIVGSIKAISKYTKELEFFATRDPLTQLYNQNLFWELFHYEIERAKRHNYKFCLLLLDLDNFKLINDNYGHTFGDQVLQMIAKKIEVLKRKGDISCRLGGDEFALILPLCDLEQGFSVAQRLQEGFHHLDLTTPDGRLISVTASISLVVYPDHGQTAKDLFGLAQSVLSSKAKEGAKNRIVFPSPQDSLKFQEEQQQLALSIMHAVEKREIIPYFQPIYDLQTGTLLGCELLMRIKIQDEIMPAGKFISLAENLGIVTEMDFVNLEKALEILQDHRYDGYLTVNLSPKSLVLSDYLVNVQKILKKFNFPSARIIFELTERETVKNIKLLQEFISSLKRYGFQFCIDDFGSGYSSFQYIKYFPLDFVKIEGEFVVGLSKGSLVDEAIFESMVALCHRMRIKMIGEFVEDMQTIKKLREFGVDYGQGFYLGRPSSDPNFPPFPL